MLQNLYPPLLGFHGLFRWILLVVALAAIVVALSGWSGTKTPGPNLRWFGLLFVVAMDIELISGAFLYFGASAALRSALIPHGVIMLLAVLCAHLGGVLTRKGATDATKYRGAAIAWTISFVLMLGGIPR